MRTIRPLFRLISLALLLGVVADGGRASASPEVRFVLPVRGQVVPGLGFRVLSTALGFHVQGPYGPGVLEAGDVITHIDGRPVINLIEFDNLVNASTGRPIRLQVRDVRSGLLVTCLAQPIGIARPPIIGPQGPFNTPFHPPSNPIVPDGSAPTPPADSPLAARATGVKVLIIGLTNDPKIGGSVVVSMQRVHMLLLGVPKIDRNGIYHLDGHQVTAVGILNRIQTMPVAPTEALFCYYAGHGAFDASATIADPSVGHHLQIPSGDLMRKDFFDALRAKNARLTILVTDTCNVPSAANPVGRQTVEATSSGGNSPLEHLLFDHTGVLDINGASRGEFCWFSPDIGGWFTEAFVTSCSNLKNQSGVSWGMLMGSLQVNADRVFQESKMQWLSKPPMSATDLHNRQLISNQMYQRPQVFANSIRQTH